MTREEALNKAIGVLTYHQVNFCKSKEAVANMNEIIEALEKIDQEPCGDCISRSGTYQKMLDLQSRKRERYLDIDDVHNVIYKMPPVSPMPKMGAVGNVR